MNSDLEYIKKRIEENCNENRAIPFWSWNNDLQEDVLVKQIQDMKDAGMGGFIMHARTGLKTEYLSEKWFACIETCLKKAKELGMDAWIYDENGWPSGFVGGKLLEKKEYRAKFLRYEIKQEYDANAFSVYVESESGYKRIENGKAGEVYHHIYLIESPANTDILLPEVVDEFIGLTHEEYYKRFANSFGKELVGFFTDEPQFYRYETPYSDRLMQEFEKCYHENVLDGLIFLFVKDERGYVFRQKYYQLLNQLYVETFYKRLYDWCEKHNCKLTGHSIEESGLFFQMWGSAGVMPTYEYEHIPAIDKLGRICGGELAAKQVGSVASQLGKKFVLTETFACSGYDVTPEELKSIAESQYFNGVNVMCHHLYPYSLAGQGKVDHPPVFSPQSNWWKGFRLFNDYFAKLGYIISNTDENYDVLLIHPMRGVYLDYIREEDWESIRDLEESFQLLLIKLRMYGIQFQLADESILAKYGSIQGNVLRVGKCSYDKIIVPDMRTLSSMTIKLLKAYKGKILFENKINYVDGIKQDIGLQSNISFEEIVDSAKIKFYSEDGFVGITSRASELGDFIFIKNYASVAESKNAIVQTKGIAENYQALNLEDFSLQNIDEVIEIPTNGSLILVKTESAKKEHNSRYEFDITENFRVKDITENQLVLDYGQIAFEDGEYSEKLPLPQIMENLLRADYKGKITICQTFFLEEKMPLRLMMEKGNLISAHLNGELISFNESAFDVLFCEADVSNYIKVGENKFVYEIDYYQHKGVNFALFDPMATESVKNSLYYDTYIENTYVIGKFILDEKFHIKKQKELPPITKNLYKKGYPFFKGELLLEGEYFYNGIGRREILIEGRFIFAEIIIGSENINLTLYAQRDITKYLKTGNNYIKIKLYSSLRNMFGPHHFMEVKEPYSVSPYYFNMRESWGEGKSKDYTDDYAFMPFGIEKILMIKSKQ